MIRSSTVFFLTGDYISHACWDEWQVFFQEKGYNTMAPPWPGKDADTRTLRKRHPDTFLANVTIDAILHHYINIIKKLPEKPVLIGHSSGGLLAQILLNRGYGEAAVAIHATPPQGVFPYEPDFIRSNFATLGLFSSLDQPYLLPFKKWQSAFTNGMALKKQQAAYEQLVIPASKRVARDAFGSAAYVDFTKPHPPLLLLAGTDDRCVPEHLCKRVFNRYCSPHSVTDYVVNKRNHFVLGLPGWEKDAQFIFEWLQAH